jgi:hypothetical protein
VPASYSFSGRSVLRARRSGPKDNLSGRLQAFRRARSESARTSTKAADASHPWRGERGNPWGVCVETDRKGSCPSARKWGRRSDRGSVRPRQEGSQSGRHPGRPVGKSRPRSSRLTGAWQRCSRACGLSYSSVRSTRGHRAARGAMARCWPGDRSVVAATRQGAASSRLRDCPFEPKSGLPAPLHRRQCGLRTPTVFSSQPRAGDPRSGLQALLLGRDRRFDTGILAARSRHQLRSPCSPEPSSS